MGGPERLATTEAVVRAARERSEQERDIPLLDTKGSHPPAHPLVSMADRFLG